MRFPLPASLFLLALSCVALIVLLSFPISIQPLMHRVAFDMGHVPLFGVFALAMLGLLRKPSEPARLAPYVWSLALSIGMGLTSEAVQFVGPRDADLGDLFRNVAGSTSFLLLAFSFDRAVAGRIRRPALTRGARWIAMGLLLAGFSPAFLVGLAFLRRNAAFPVIYEPNAAWVRPLSKVREGWIEGATLPGGEPATKVSFLPGRYPSLIVNEPYPDWSAFRFVTFEVHSDRAQENFLWVRIDDDGSDDQDAYTWYVESFIIDAGANEIRIPLSEVRDAPRGRAMDLEHIKLFMFFVAQPKQRVVLTVGRIRLEK